MKKKYFVVDSRGQKHTRSSDRLYTNAVVTRWAAEPDSSLTWKRKERIEVNWCGRYDLACAQFNRAINNGASAGDVEILKAQIEETKRK